MPSVLFEASDFVRDLLGMGDEDYNDVLNEVTSDLHLDIK